MSDGEEHRTRPQTEHAEAPNLSRVYRVSYEEGGSSFTNVYETDRLTPGMRVEKGKGGWLGPTVEVTEVTRNRGVDQPGEAKAKIVDAGPGRSGTPT